MWVSCRSTRMKSKLNSMKKLCRTMPRLQLKIQEVEVKTKLCRMWRTGFCYWVIQIMESKIECLVDTRHYFTACWRTAVIETIGMQFWKLSFSEIATTGSSLHLTHNRECEYPVYLLCPPMETKAPVLNCFAQHVGEWVWIIHNITEVTPAHDEWPKKWHRTFCSPEVKSNLS